MLEPVEGAPAVAVGDVAASEPLGFVAVLGGQTIALRLDAPIGEPRVSEGGAD